MAASYNLTGTLLEQLQRNGGLTSEQIRGLVGDPGAYGGIAKAFDPAQWISRGADGEPQRDPDGNVIYNTALMKQAAQAVGIDTSQFTSPDQMYQALAPRAAEFAQYYNLTQDAAQKGDAQTRSRQLFQLDPTTGTLTAQGNEQLLDLNPESDWRAYGQDLAKFAAVAGTAGAAGMASGAAAPGIATAGAPADIALASGGSAGGAAGAGAGGGGGGTGGSADMTGLNGPYDTPTSSTGGEWVSGESLGETAGVPDQVGSDWATGQTTTQGSAPWTSGSDIAEAAGTGTGPVLTNGGGLLDKLGLSPQVTQALRSALQSTSGSASGSNSTNPLAALLAAVLNRSTANDQAATNQQALDQYAGQVRQGTQQSVDLARFRPVNVSGTYGSTGSTVDANGNVTGVNYTLTPEMAAQRDALFGKYKTAISGINTDPTQATNDLMSKYQAIAAPQRQTLFDNLQSQLAAKGLMGLKTYSGQGGAGEANAGASNPYFVDFAQGVARDDQTNYLNFFKTALDSIGTQINNAGSLFGQSTAIDKLGSDQLTTGLNYSNAQANAGSRAGIINQEGVNTAGDIQARGIQQRAQAQAAGNTSMTNASTPLFSGLFDAFIRNL